MLHDLKYYCDSAKEMFTNDDARDDLYQKIDNAAGSQFENPPELKALPWINERKFVTTAPADALQAAIRTFAARLPQISIQPLSEDPMEYDRTEQMESLMKWEFTRMNSIQKKSPHWKIVEYAMKYCAVAIETVYLPYAYQDVPKTPRIKEILRNRQFKWNVHNPANIHVRESDDVTESVLNSCVMTAQELIDRFGLDNPGIREMMLGFEKEDAQALNTKKFSFYDYVDWDARVKWIVPNDGASYVNRQAPQGIELMRKERTVSFLPWVFVDNEEPILKQMIASELWENVNILRTMQFSKAVDMVAHPEYWIQTPDGTLRGVSLDPNNPNQPLVTIPGVTVNKLAPPNLDPQLTNILAEAEQEVFRTTVAQVLASVEKYAGTQNFSVVNAMLNAAVAQLALSQMVIERAESQALIQNFRWIDETKIPMVGFRAYTSSEKRQRGQEIVIKPDDFDPDYLYLSVKLNPATMMDEQTQINNAINAVERLGKSKKMVWDEMNWENYELSEAQVSEEQLYTAHIQAKQKEIMMKPDLEAQAMQQQMQMAAQQAQQQGNPGAAPQSQFAAQQGMDTRGGGASATMPGQGREQLTGQSASGQGLA